MGGGSIDRRGATCRIGSVDNDRAAESPDRERACDEFDGSTNRQLRTASGLMLGSRARSGAQATMVAHRPQRNEALILCDGLRFRSGGRSAPSKSPSTTRVTDATFDDRCAAIPRSALSSRQRIVGNRRCRAPMRPSTATASFYCNTRGRNCSSTGCSASIRTNGHRRPAQLLPRARKLSLRRRQRPTVRSLRDARRLRALPARSRHC